MKETGTWSKFNITLSSGQSLRHLSFKTDSFEGRVPFFARKMYSVSCFFLKLQDEVRLQNKTDPPFLVVAEGKGGDGT